MYLLNPGDGRDVQHFTVLAEAIVAYYKAHEKDAFTTLYFVRRDGALVGKGFTLLRYLDGSFYDADMARVPIKVIEAAQKAVR